MAETIKITKKMVLEAIKGAAEAGAEFGETVSAEDVIAYVDTAIAQLDSKAAKAKERAAKNRAEGDALRTVVESVLTNELQTREEIFAQIDNADGSLSIAKIGARLTQLCTNGKAIKENIKTETGKKMAYRLA